MNVELLLTVVFPLRRNILLSMVGQNLVVKVADLGGASRKKEKPVKEADVGGGAIGQEQKQLIGGNISDVEGNIVMDNTGVQVNWDYPTHSTCNRLPPERVGYLMSHLFV